MSTFTWLDYSDRDRRRAMDVVDLLREEDTRDELGLGVIRDALSDQLFPGTSTIQTRVRYFLFVPWVLQQLDLRHPDLARFGERLRSTQDRLRKALLAGHEAEGVIGFRAGFDVKRLPSSVYWHGLRRLGILRFDGSEYELARASRQAATRHIVRDDDGTVVDGTASAFFDPEMLAAPSGWLTSTTFSLQRGESAYLQRRIDLAAPHSLLAFLLHRRINPGVSAFVWDCVNGADLPEPLVEELNHARRFSEAMHGAALLYNLMLAEEKESSRLIDDYREAMAEWWQLWSTQRADFARWQRRAFWGLLGQWGARVRLPTVAFVESWLDGVGRAKRVDDVIGSRAMRDQIRRREVSLKKARARLGNPPALRTWNGASGTGQLDYRWGRPVRGMVRDLLGITTEGRNAPAR